MNVIQRFIDSSARPRAAWPLWFAATLLPMAASAALVPGGIGIHATGKASVTVCSSVTGGLATDGVTRSPAVAFSGGDNTLTLEAGYQLTGAVTSDGSGDTLALGGDATTHCGQPGDATLTVDSAFRQQFTGFSSYAKTGSSAWTVSGSDTSMDWTVTGGMLELDGNFGSADVGASATLAGTGTLDGKLTLAPAGTLRPGAATGSGIGSLSAGALDWQAGAVMAFQLGDSAAHSDRLVLSGALQKVASGSFAFQFADGSGTPQVGTSYPLISYASASGFSAGDFSYSYSGAATAMQGHFVLGTNTLSFVVDAVSWSLGGTVTGLTGSGLTLSLDNGAETLPISADGKFTFTTPVAANATFAVTIASQPSQPTQQCVVINGSGSMPGHDLDNIVVNCGPANTYTVGGQVSGLSSGSVTLTLNGGHATTLSGNGPYAFPVQFASGSSYIAAISAQPDGQHCDLGHASGTIGGSDVMDVDVNCSGAPLQTSVVLLDDGDYARYGAIHTYLVHVANHSSHAAQNINVGASFSAAFDEPNVSWQCFPGDPKAACTPQGHGGFGDTITLPGNGGLSFVVSAPVLAGSPAPTATITLLAQGASSVSDTNTLVLLRDGFDAAYSGGVPTPPGPTPSARPRAGQAGLAITVPHTPVNSVRTLRGLQAHGARLRVQLAHIDGNRYVRLLVQPAGGMETAGRWSRVAAGATLVLGGVRGSNGQHIALLEGAGVSLHVAW